MLTCFVILEPGPRAQQGPGPLGSRAPKFKKRRGLMQNEYKRHEMITIFCNFARYSCVLHCLRTIFTSPVTLISNLLRIVVPEWYESCPVHVLPVIMLSTRFVIHYFLGHSPKRAVLQARPRLPSESVGLGLAPVL